MASNYTENYQLPLWAADDAFLRTEFNDANEKIDAALGTIPKVESGSYTGDGTYGADNPCSLTFSFQPKLVLISPSDISDRGEIFFPMTAVYGAEQACSCWSGYSYRGDYCVLSWAGNTLTWYSAGQYGQAGSQYNVSGKTYHYLAIG